MIPTPKKLVAGVLLALLSSCATAPPSAEELANADYGPVPAVDYEVQIRSTMDAALKNPASAHYEFSSPERDWASALEGGYLFGWKVDFMATFGGYEGEHPYKAFFYKGELEGILEPYREPFSNSVGWSVVATLAPEK